MPPSFPLLRGTETLARILTAYCLDLAAAVLAQQEDSYRVQGEGGVRRGEGPAAGARARRTGQGSCSAVVDGIGTARLASLLSSSLFSQKPSFRFLFNEGEVFLDRLEWSASSSTRNS